MFAKEVTLLRTDLGLKMGLQRKLVEWDGAKDQRGGEEQEEKKSCRTVAGQGRWERTMWAKEPRETYL